MVAYGCAPDRGSEAGVGWNRAVQIARFFDTWLICEESEFGPGVRRYLEQHGEIPGLHFHFVPQKPWESLLWRLPGAGYIAYNLWQRRVLRVARRLHGQHQFDLAHQLTFCSYREPGYLWKLDIPFVWGPIGGVQNLPWRFLGRAGAVAAGMEGLRTVCNKLQLHLGRRIARAARKAAVLFTANSTTREAFSQAYGVESLLFSDTGISQSGSMAPTQSGPRPLRILWVGQLAARKALDLLIDALARLPADVDFELRVVGEGRQKQRWQRRAKHAGLESRITWIGRLSHEETLRQYSWADVFVFSSLRDTSACVNLEALAAGVPIVCLDHQGVHDIVTEQCGVKIPVTRPREVISRLAVAIEHLACDDDFRQRLARGAVERAQNYLWSRGAEEMADIYRQVLEPEEDGRAHQHQHGITSRNNAAAGHSKKPRHVLTHCRRWLGAEAAVQMRRLLGSRAENRFGILLYHRIANLPAGHPQLPGTISAKCFGRQMTGLLKRGYTPWSLQRVWEYQAEGRTIPPKTFVVTFDDGYECLYNQAWPILKALGIPATVFLVTKYLDGDCLMAFGEDTKVAQCRCTPSLWRSLSTAQCSEMLAHGLIEFGSHTHTHDDFCGKPEALQADLEISLDVLRERLGLAQASFAFPFGYHDTALVAAAKRAGVTCALSTHTELVVPHAASFTWGRFEAESYDNAAKLAAKLDGWYSIVQNGWYRWRDRDTQHNASSLVRGVVPGKNRPALAAMRLAEPVSSMNANASNSRGECR